MSMDINHEANKADKDAFLKRLADLGPERVRAMMASGMFPTGHHVVVLEWLGESKPRS